MFKEAIELAAAAGLGVVKPRLMREGCILCSHGTLEVRPVEPGPRLVPQCYAVPEMARERETATQYPGKRRLARVGVSKI